MKKLGKKISFLTKIMLVIGLLISNLSSLSVVFAYEGTDNVVFALEEDKLNIEYIDALAEDVQKVRVDVYESYTYLDSTKDEYPVVEYEIDTTEMDEDRVLKLVHPKSTFEEFDGTYKVVVEIYKIMEVEAEPVNELESLENITPEVTEELMATGTFEKEVTYKSGLKINVYDNNDTKLGLSNGKYVLSNSDSVRIDAYVLAGGLAPSDMFVYEGQTYTASELKNVAFSLEHTFGGKLYGEYSIPVMVEVEKVVEEEASLVLEDDTLVEEDSTIEVVPEEVDNKLKYTGNISVMYGTYEGNNDVLNDVVNSLGMNGAYFFDGTSKDGKLYKYINLTEDTNEFVNGTMLDLYNIINTSVDGTVIEYKLLKNNEDLIKKYNDTYGVLLEDDATLVTTEEEVTPTVSLEDYLKEISVDDTVKVVLTSLDLTVSYSVIVLADLNNDNKIDNADVSELIELVLASSTDNKADLDGNGKVNNLDVLYLQEVVKNKDWNITIVSEDATLGTSLDTGLTEEEVLVSGDEFVVDYVLKLTEDEVSGFSGMLVYDKEALELVSVESLIDSVGGHNEATGKFSYFGSEALELPEATEETTPVDVTDEVMTVDTEDEVTVVTMDHTVLRAKFRVLKSGNHTVSIKDSEYYNLATYLNVSDSDVSATVEVLMSDDNKLTYLEVAGSVIELVEEVYEYEITVENEVTLVDLKYILSNVAASVTSTIYPEELAEGVNEVVVTVTSESGITQDYKVIVNRKEAKKETTTQVNYNNYQPNYNVPEEEEEPVVPVEPTEPKEEKEGNASKIIIIILIVLVIGGLVYLIFKDDSDDEGANKKVNNLKKDTSDFASKEVKAVKTTKTSGANSKSKTGNSKSKTNQKNTNKKKER